LGLSKRLTVAVERMVFVFMYATTSSNTF